MYYRVVCSGKDFYDLFRKFTVVNMVYDLQEMDDYIYLKSEYQPSALIILNIHSVRKLLFSNGCNNSFYGIVLDLDKCDNLSLVEIVERYTKGGKEMLEIKVEELKDEKVGYSDDDLYNINSWGADLSFREIINMYTDDELQKPELQRKYVWKRVEASRFIDSILLGLPVPSVFFAKEPNETMLIIDGYQRIMTVYDYVNGIFSGDGKVFKLSNTENINSRWRGKAFAELEPEEKRRIRNTTIHAIIFEQKHPRNDTGMYQVFERINTGGRTLKEQEIRNCVYQGPCNDLLFELNTTEAWRNILGLAKEDARMADLELILRFFAMNDLKNREEFNLKQINLAKYLNQYMNEKNQIDDEEQEKMKNMFLSMIKACESAYGKDAFKNLKKDSIQFTSKINPAIYDAISVATAYAIEKGIWDSSINYKERYIQLLKNEKFIEAASKRTTNVENIIARINFASESIYGMKYE